MRCRSRSSLSSLARCAGARRPYELVTRSQAGRPGGGTMRRATRGYNSPPSSLSLTVDLRVAPLTVTGRPPCGARHSGTDNFQSTGGRRFGRPAEDGPRPAEDGSRHPSRRTRPLPALRLLRRTWWRTPRPGRRRCCAARPTWHADRRCPGSCGVPLGVLWVSLSAQAAPRLFGPAAGGSAGAAGGLVGTVDSESEIQ